MPGITRSNDAYGHELWACLTEGRGDEIVERDDGFIAASDAARLANGRRYSPGPAGGKTGFLRSDGPVYVAVITRTP